MLMIASDLGEKPNITPGDTLHIQRLTLLPVYQDCHPMGERNYILSWIHTDAYCERVYVWAQE